MIIQYECDECNSLSDTEDEAYDCCGAGYNTVYFCPSCHQYHADEKTVEQHLLEQESITKEPDEESN